MKNEIIYVGIDNGVSGTMGAVKERGRLLLFRNIPIFSSQDYTKAKKKINRVSCFAMMGIMKGLLELAGGDLLLIRAFVERPMVNPGRFMATASGLRAYEATLIALEKWSIVARTIDSKQWQKAMLPAGEKGPALKVASMDIGCRLFPSVEEEIRKHKDADGLLIAEAARRGKW